MSIDIAVKEISKEIHRLRSEADRLEKLREQLQPKDQTPFDGNHQLVTKTTTAKKSVSSKVVPARKKRVLTPEGKKRIIEANKRMWARRKKASAKP